MCSRHDDIAPEKNTVLDPVSEPYMPHHGEHAFPHSEPLRMTSTARFDTQRGECPGQKP